jgi:hypothetical protein
MLAVERALSSADGNGDESTDDLKGAPIAE